MAAVERSNGPLHSPAAPRIGKYNIPLNIGKTSSIGDVGTIRTQLQHRRVQLNKEISLEQHITKGSKKLSKMPSLDKKTRDLASLEHQFSVSKIQLLQAELTKINSSLQAYQPESARDKQVPLIPLSSKTTGRLSFVAPITDLAQKHYYIDPILIQDALYEFQELRFSMATPTKDDAGVLTLFEYISHLSLVGKRFLHRKLSAHGVTFVWHDAISGYPAAQRGVVFEKACVIYNIAALYTQIAAQQDRSTREGIETAINYLEKSLGVFEYMKHNFSYSPTMDMTPEVLAFLSDLVRAQAIELQWDMLIFEGMDKQDIKKLVNYSQRTKSVSECYRPLRELVEENPLKDYIPQCWSALIKIKDAHYKALAHYYAAVLHEMMYLVCTGSISSHDIEAHRASIATELHFLYTSDTTNIDELFSIDPKQQMGLVRSHLNCASVLHEFALKFKSVSKQLDPVSVLQRVLEEAGTCTQSMKDRLSAVDSVAMISPAVQPSIVDLNPIIPSFAKVKVQDTFKAVGPLPKFSADYSWGPPRKMAISRRRNGYGFTVRGSKPVRISGIDDTSDGKSLIVGDWIITVNGQDTRSLAHNDVVKLIQNSLDDLLEIEVVTPEGGEAPPTPTSTTPPTII